MIKNFKWLLLVSLTFVACSKNDDGDKVTEVPVTAGTADFTKYVALGNSLTAGFSDGALFKKGQEGSYPNILSQQFAKVGGGEFKTPFCGDDNLGGLLLGGFPIQSTRLYFNGVAPTNVAGTPKTEITAVLTGPFNNMGVPGAKSFHLLASGYGNVAGVPSGAANPYFARFAKSPGSNILADALEQNATFFSLWIGNNDVLSYAMSGGQGINQLGNLNPATYGANDITDPNVFANVYSTLIDNLVAKGAKGVVANIPYVNTIPFFTTVPTNPIPALPTSNATQLNQVFGAINQIAEAANLPPRFIILTTDDGNPKTIEVTNPLLIFDESLQSLSNQIAAVLTPVVGGQTATFLGNLYGRARHAKKAKDGSFEDYVLLTTRGILTPPNNIQAGVPSPFNVQGISYPLQDGRVLTNAEVTELKTATDAYNATIKGLAEAKGLAFVDANSILNKVYKTGIRFGNFQLTSTYVTGGAFSLDGIHPSSRGYAFIANEFMKAINTTYGSTFRPVDLSLYPIQFPATIN